MGVPSLERINREGSKIRNMGDNWKGKTWPEGVAGGRGEKKKIPDQREGVDQIIKN